MNLILNVDQFNQDNIYFNSPIKNNIIRNSLFSRIIYSTNLFTINGLNFLINLNHTSVEHYYNKYKCNFKSSTYNANIIQLICNIEQLILTKFNMSKCAVYNIRDQLQTQNFKIFANNDHINSIILKISGIWETENNYGITYKFIGI
jgi:hypothetical protein